MKNLITVSMIALAAPGVAQLAPRSPALTKDLEARLAAHGHPDRLVLKLIDDVPARAVEGRLVSGIDMIRDVGSVLEQHGAKVDPLIPYPPDELSFLRSRAEQLGGRHLADLSQLYAVRVSGDATARALIERLLMEDVVEDIYRAPYFSSPGDCPPKTIGDVSGTQGVTTASYSDLYAYQEAEGSPDGAEVTVFVIERDWNGNHEDLSHLASQDPPVVLVDDSCLYSLDAGCDPDDVSIAGDTLFATGLGFDKNHGTATLGILAADHDEAVGCAPAGIRGVAHGAQYHLVFASPDPANLDYQNPALAIVRAARSAEPGDVLLIELQQADSELIPQPCGANPDEVGGGPLEQGLAEFYAIQLATSLGVHVVEPAGNHGVRHSDDIDIDFRDSGAIIVGSVDDVSPCAQRLQRESSNYGPRVDCYELGDGATTLGSYPASVVQDDSWTPALASIAGYTGTSAAGAIVAGKVALISSHYQLLFGQAARPHVMRSLLAGTGRPANRRCGTGVSDEVVGRGGNLYGISNRIGQSSYSFSPLPPVFTHEPWSALPCGESVVLETGYAGDFDADGRSDLFAYSEEDGFLGEDGFVVSTRTGRRLSFPASLGARQLDNRSFRRCFLDDDDVDDYAYCNRDGSSFVTVVSGAKAWSAEDRVLAMVQVPDRAESVAFGDFDGGGDMDIAFGCPLDDLVYVFLGEAVADWSAGAGWSLAIGCQLSPSSQVGEEFGHRIVAVPGAGRDYLAVSAPGHDGGAGAIYFLGAGSLPVVGASLELDPSDVGPTGGELGRGLSSAGPDAIAAGAPGANHPDGMVRHYGIDAGVLATPTTPWAGMALQSYDGFSQLENGDPDSIYVLGALGTEIADLGEQQGSVSLAIAGSGGGVALVTTDPTVSFGYEWLPPILNVSGSLSTAGDATGDGQRDLLYDYTVYGASPPAAPGEAALAVSTPTLEATDVDGNGNGGGTGFVNLGGVDVFAAIPEKATFTVSLPDEPGSFVVLLWTFDGVNYQFLPPTQVNTLNDAGNTFFQMGPFSSTFLCDAIAAAPAPELGLRIGIIGFVDSLTHPNFFTNQVDIWFVDEFELCPP